MNEVPNNNNISSPNNRTQSKAVNTELEKTNNSTITGNTEVLDVAQNNKSAANNSQYEQVTPQFQEVTIQKEAARTDSYFDGGLLELIGWKILAFLITVFTLGFGAPWGKCMLYNYQFKHTVFNGKRLKFEGTGGDLFVHYFKWIFLSIITLGIYAFVVPVRKARWVISNLHFEDENLVKGESYFDGKTLHLIGINILCNILNIISLGLLFTFTTCFKLKWINKHTVINRKKLAFTGGALGLFGKYLLWIFLSIITLGIYGLWVPIKMLKWQTKNTHIKTVGEQEVKDNTLWVAIPIAIIGIALFAFAMPKVVSVASNMDIQNPFDGKVKISNKVSEANYTQLDY